MDELRAQAESRAEQPCDCRPTSFLKQSKISVTSIGFTQILRITIFFQEEQSVQKQTVQNSWSRHHRLMSQTQREGQLCLRHPLSMFPKEPVSPFWTYQQVSRTQDIALTPSLGSVFEPIISSVPENPPLFPLRREIPVNKNFQSMWTKCISLACFLKEIVFISSIPKYFLVQLHFLF